MVEEIDLLKALRDAESKKPKTLEGQFKVAVEGVIDNEKFKSITKEEALQLVASAVETIYT